MKRARRQTIAVASADQAVPYAPSPRLRPAVDGRHWLPDHKLAKIGQMRPLTTNLSEGSKRPYFLWDEDISIDELRDRLRGGPVYERERLLGKMLREARDIDVWNFVTPEEVAKALPALDRRLGRRRDFWRFLIDGWRSDGLLRG